MMYQARIPSSLWLTLCLGSLSEHMLAVRRDELYRFFRVLLVAPLVGTTSSIEGWVECPDIHHAEVRVRLCSPPLLTAPLRRETEKFGFTD